MRSSPLFTLIFTFTHLVYSQKSFSAPLRRIPFELESSGPDGLTNLVGGSASSEGSAATRVNPANLALKKTYELGVGFFWNDYSRGFYEASIADSVSSGFAAGLSFQALDPSDISQNRNKKLDSGLTRRLSVALAKNVKSLSLGFSVANIAWDEPSQSNMGIEKKSVSAYSLSGGANLFLTPEIRVGLSAENFASNDDKRIIVPKIARFGIHYGGLGSYYGFDVDYRQRSRVQGFESVEGIPYGLLLSADSTFDKEDSEQSDQGYQDNEQLLSAGAQIIVYDRIQFKGSLGQSLGQKDVRRFYSGGISVVDQIYQLGYAFARPYQDYSSIQHSLNFSLAVSL